MDTKRLLTTLLIVGAAMLLFNSFFNKGTPTPKIISPIFTTIPASPLAAEGGAKPELITMGDASKQSKDKMAVTINTQTAGITRVQLNINDYAQTVERKDPLTLFESDPTLGLPFATLGVHITVGASTQELVYGRGVNNLSPAADIAAANGKSILENQYVWKVKSKTDTDLELLMSFQMGDKPIAEVTKKFHFNPASYEMTISHSVKNLTDQPLKVQIDQLGPSEFPRDDPQQDDRYFHGANLESAKKRVEGVKGFNASQLELLKVDTGTKPIGQFNDYATDPQLWIASSNRFFTTIVRPLPMGDTPRITLDVLTIPTVTHIAKADLDIMKSALPVDDASSILAIVRFTGSTVDVAPGATVDEPLSVYMGPKTRAILDGTPTAPVDSPEYSRAAYHYSAMIQLSQGGCYSFCTRDEVIRPILVLLEFFKNYVAFGNYGVAIMILVIVVRAAMHPLTRASQINMAIMSKKMKDIQPQMDAATRKYEGNSKKLNEEKMRIYKENKVNPAGGVLGCLPMLIQMPIWAALYSGLRTDIDLRHAAFIPGWIDDLSHPDTVLPHPARLIGHPLFHLPVLGDIYGLNLLPLLLTAVFFIQMKVSAASQPKITDPQQAQMANISKYMIFIFPIFLYSGPSGLNLYIFASTMGGLVDTWLVRKTLKKRGILPASAQTLPTHEQK